jgi:hypothetical protein
MMKYDEPTIIVGTTKHGKSYFAKKTLLEQDSGVLYFNTLTDNADMWGFTYADGSNSMEQLYRAICSGEKINFQPSLNRVQRESQLEYMFLWLLKHKGIEYIFALDEVHLFEGNKNIDSLLREVSQTGRHFGITPTWITQRPQQLPRPCMTQANQVIFFNMNFEDSWLKNYGVNADQLRQQIQGRKYYYCRWTPGGGLEGAKKL